MAILFSHTFNARLTIWINLFDIGTYRLQTSQTLIWWVKERLKKFFWKPLRIYVHQLIQPTSYPNQIRDFLLTVYESKYSFHLIKN
ncbi:hypothetical protein BGP_0255 [Beggiatoa sp. PS]|nr:hypothetical protein BGP_0255 [Beggiatoa sp. PS]